MNPPVSPSRGYEVEDAHPRLIGQVAAIVAGTIIASMVVVGYIYHRSYIKVAGPNRQTSFTHSSQYRTSIATEWSGLDRDSDVHLHTYGWVDRQHGIVRIPIERAMDLVAQEAVTPQKQ